MLEDRGRSKRARDGAPPKPALVAKQPDVPDRVSHLLASVSAASCPLLSEIQKQVLRSELNQFVTDFSDREANLQSVLLEVERSRVSALAVIREQKSLVQDLLAQVAKLTALDLAGSRFLFLSLCLSYSTLCVSLCILFL